MILDSSYVLNLLHGNRDASETGETLVHVAARADVLGNTVLTENVTDFGRLGIEVDTYRATTGS